MPLPCSKLSNEFFKIKSKFLSARPSVIWFKVRFLTHHLPTFPLFTLLQKHRSTCCYLEIPNQAHPTPGFCTGSSLCLQCILLWYSQSSLPHFFRSVFRYSPERPSMATMSKVALSSISFLCFDFLHCIYHFLKLLCVFVCLPVLANKK